MSGDHTNGNAKRDEESPLTDDAGSHVSNESPPFGGSWRTLYALVLAWLALQVVLFYLFTRAFR